MIVGNVVGDGSEVLRRMSIPFALRYDICTAHLLVSLVKRGDREPGGRVTTDCRLLELASD